MWLFTTRGFFSVVQKWDDPAQVQVRARIAADLDELREACPALGATIQLKNTDYPYRAIVSKEALGEAVKKLVVEQLDYTNFKATVEKRQGRPREELYSRVWGEMYNAEEKLKRAEQLRDEGPADLPWTPVQKSEAPGGLHEFVTRGLKAQRAADRVVAPKRAKKRAKKRSKKNRRK